MATFLDNIPGGVSNFLFGTGTAQDSITNAMNAQSNAMNANVGEQQRALQMILGEQAPYRNMGYAALPYLQEAILGKGFSSLPLSAMGRSQGDFYSQLMGQRGILGKGGYNRGLQDIYDADRENQYQRFLAQAKLGQPAANVTSGAYQQAGTGIANANMNYSNMVSPMYGQRGSLYTNYSPMNIGMDLLGGAGRSGLLGGFGKSGPLVIGPGDQLVL